MTKIEIISCYTFIGKPIDIFAIEMEYYHQPKVQLSKFDSDLSSITQFPCPIIAGEMRLGVAKSIPLQVQLYGSPIASKITVKVDSVLKLLLCNDSMRPIYLTLMCFEQTGMYNISVEV